MKTGDRFRRTHSLGSVQPQYQVGYESNIASIDMLAGIPLIKDSNGHEHYISYIEIIRNPLAEIDDLRAEITALREMLQTPAIGNLYHDTATDERIRILDIQPQNHDTIVVAAEGRMWDRRNRLGSVFRGEVASGRLVRIPG